MSSGVILNFINSQVIIFFLNVKMLLAFVKCSPDYFAFVSLF